MAVESRVAVLGSTGSIGVAVLDVAERLGFPVASLAAHRQVALIEAQARRFRPAVAALYDEDAARDLKIRLADTSVRVLSGEEGIGTAAVAGDIALNGIVGIRGLAPTLAAVDAGVTVALANKESLVCAGEIVLRRARAKNARIIPVDSEHSAIFQCLQEKNLPEKIILTCSGGVFYGKTRAEAYHFTRREALLHPVWRMGEKITIDSATLFNKGLEIIEAMHLFGVTADQIEVLIHRESVVHSAVEFADGAVVAQLGTPDMRLPIQYALTYPARVGSPAARLDLTTRPLTFTHPDPEAHPALPLAYAAARRGGTAGAILNGANEAAVALFLREETHFGMITDAVAHALETVEASPIRDLADVYAADREAREKVTTFIGRP